MPVSVPVGISTAKFVAATIFTDLLLNLRPRFLNGARESKADVNLL